jgi:tRNA threonylcarbamoyladenosine biosynthesis protein TsaE
MRRLGSALANGLPDPAGPPIVIALDGELGSGKTTLTGGFLAALGIAGPYRSPTYTLIEPYEAPARRIYHLDLYRIAAPEELIGLGLRDLLEPGAVLIVEWARRAQDALAARDVELQLAYGPELDSRTVAATPRSAAGALMLLGLGSSIDAELVPLSR